MTTPRAFLLAVQLGVRARRGLNPGVSCASCLGRARDCCRLVIIPFRSGRRLGLGKSDLLNRLFLNNHHRFPLPKQTLLQRPGGVPYS